MMANIYGFIMLEKSKKYKIEHTVGYLFNDNQKLITMQKALKLTMETIYNTGEDQLFHYRPVEFTLYDNSRPEVPIDLKDLLFSRKEISTDVKDRRIKYN